MSKTYKNPILTGFHPDPSVCRVGEDYYLVTSTFEYFPGLPIFHSTDLVNWNQIGHVIDRNEQINYDNIRPSGGLYAPTIRYHNGTFYVINTHVDGIKESGNFIVTAEDPVGPWSDPVWIDDAPGIDPSLFFDDDAKIWYTGNRIPPSGEQFEGHREIWLQEIDSKTFQLKGERYGLFDGAVKGAVHAEAPHIYKKDDYYYLMIAEAGTAHEHAVTIARSKNITGPYESNLMNPVLTHRHLGRDYPIVGTGHADLIETQNGDWWMVALGMRPYGGYYYNLGRETFLVPVVWEDGWPIVSPGTGKIEWEYDRPDLPESRKNKDETFWDFKKEPLSYCWNFLRNPHEKFWSCSKNGLVIKLQKEKITDQCSPSFIGQRQRHINFIAETEIIFSPENENEEAGFVILQNNKYLYSFLISLKNNQKILNLVKTENGKETVIKSFSITNNKLVLGCEANGQDYTFYVCDDKRYELSVDGRILSTPVAGGFVGAYLGMYASSNGKQSENGAVFKWFKYEGIL